MRVLWVSDTHATLHPEVEALTETADRLHRQHVHLPSVSAGLPAFEVTRDGQGVGFEGLAPSSTS